MKTEKSNSYKFDVGMKHRYSCTTLRLDFSENKSTKKKRFGFILGMSALPPACHYSLSPSKLLKSHGKTL